VPAFEITSSHEGRHDLHLLGYRIDPADPGLEAPATLLAFLPPPGQASDVVRIVSGRRGTVAAGRLASWNGGGRLLAVPTGVGGPGRIVACRAVAAQLKVSAPAVACRSPQRRRAGVHSFR